MTNDRVLELLLEIKEDISALRVDIKETQVSNEVITKDLANLNTRVAGLEKDAWRAKGAIAFLGVIALVTGLLKSLFP